MRNLLWTATAVLVMLATVGVTQAQVALPLTPPTVEPKVNGLANPPVGNKDCYAKGTYTIPANATVNKVVAKWYEEAGNGNLIFKGTTDDLAPANNKYVTSDLRIATGKTYTVIVTVYINGPGGVNDPVQSGPSGIATGFAP